MEIKKKDFTVVGAGIAGMCAAVSAARKGLQVALINDRSVLGGNASSEIGVSINGAGHGGLNPAIYTKEGGLIEEIRQKLLYAQTDRGFNVTSAKDVVFFEFIYGEPNIELFLNTVVTKVETEDQKITAVYAYNSKSETNFKFESPIFADCTGDGFVGFQAGASFEMGSESKDQYGEKWAGEEKTPHTMGSTILWKIEDMGKPVKFVAPPFAIDITKMENFEELKNPLKFRNLSVSGGSWTFEYGGQVNTIKDFEDVQWELRRLAYGVWDYVKNSGEFPEAANYRMGALWTIPGTRESRRFIGDHVLTENDVEQKVRFEDSVATGGWPMDVHDWGGFYGSLPASNFISVTGVYDIPFRCLYSKDIQNMMMAGRNISATHIALGSTRVMATCGCLGQAVGTAAALCKKYNTLPRGIYQDHIKELQKELLHDDQMITGFADLDESYRNKNFTISSTGSQKFENTRQEGERVMNHNYGLALLTDTEEIESVKIKLRNLTNQQQEVKVEIFTGDRPETFLPSKVLCKKTLTLEPNFYGYTKIEIGGKIGPDHKVYIVFPKNENIAFCYSKTRPLGAVTWRYYDKSHTIGDYRDRESMGYNHDTCPLDWSLGYGGCDHQDHMNMCFKDIVPQQEIFREQNLLNEYTRPYGSMNMWVSDGMAASVVLDAKSPQDVEELQLIFDTDLEQETLRQMPKRLVKDYDLTVIAETGTTTYEIRENCERLNRHFLHINGVTQIKIDILDVYGGDVAAMYGIKIK